MHLPKPIYEGLPYLYIIVGVLFNAGIMYVGLDAPWAPHYLVVSVVCTVSGLVVFFRRQIYRRKAQSNDANDAV